MPALEWICRTVAILLALGGGSLAVWGFWADHLRGKTKARRCPKCWYNLDAAPSSPQSAWLCPECGHNESRESRLHRTRRRWWPLAPAFLLVTLAALAWSWPTIDRLGWRASVPAGVVVRFWPIDEVRWMEGSIGTVSEMATELDLRMTGDRIGRASLNAWARRIENRYQREGRLHIPANSTSNSQFRRFDERDLLETMASLDDRASVMPLTGCFGDHPDFVASEIIPRATPDWVGDQRDSLIKIVQDIVARDSWIDNGGADGFIKWSGTNLLVVNTPAALDQVATLLDALSRSLHPAPGSTRAATRTHALDVEGLPVVIRDVRDVYLTEYGPTFMLAERIDRVVQHISEIEPDTWVINGGETGWNMSVDGLLITRHTPEVQAKIDALLAQHRAESNRR